MNDGWAQPIRRQYTGGDARFDLPTRPLGLARLIGVVLIGFSAVFVWGPGRDLWELVQKGTQRSGGGLENILLLFQLALVLAGLLPAGLGLLMLFGRCTVEWKEGRLRVAERLGPLRWTRRLPRRPIRRFIVGVAASETPQASTRQWERFSSLAAEFEDNSKRLVVLGYPRSWLLELAQELSDYAGVAAASPVAVVEQVGGQTPDQEVPEQPPGSQVRLEEHAGGICLIAPPAGVVRGSKGLFFGALVWSLVMVLFTAMAVYVIPNQNTQGPTVVLWVFLLVFWLIGVGLMLGALNMGKRSAVLTADRDRLTVEVRGLFGAKQWQWRRDELAAIRADASGMVVNNRPVMELQVHPRVGRKVGLLAGRNEDELHWMAGRLRGALRLPARPETD